MDLTSQFMGMKGEVVKTPTRGHRIRIVDVTGGHVVVQRLDAASRRVDRVPLSVLNDVAERVQAGEQVPTSTITDNMNGPVAALLNAVPWVVVDGKPQVARTVPGYDDLSTQGRAMATAWLQYWAPAQLEREREQGGDGDPLVDTAGEQFGRVVPGDAVYVLSRTGTSLLLIGRLIVDHVLDEEAAEAHFGTPVYEASVHLLGHGSARRLNRVIKKGVAMQLRRASGKPLVDSDGNADGEKLQTVGPLSDSSVALLDDVIDRDDAQVRLSALPEGAPVERKHRSVERNRGLREAALRIHGHDCQACGFSFEETYGLRGVGFAEVHHLMPFSSLRGRTVMTNPATDLAILCANCHRMVHRGEDAPLAIEKLRDELRRF